MSMTREEILPGVFLNHIRDSKFKTAVLSVSLLAQMDRVTASMNALIPLVLCRGTNNYPDIEKLSRRMDELYSLDVSPVIRSAGEVQATGLMLSFPEPKYLPVDGRYTQQAVDFLADILLNPLTRGGMLSKEYVKSEREKLAENIRSRINEKRGYSIARCGEEMCCYEAYSVGRLGSAEDCEDIGYVKLTKHYRELLQTAPVELIYCGSESFSSISGYIRTAFASMPRGEIDYDLGTDIRMNAVEDEPRYFEEQLDVTQGKLVIGFRLGEWMENPDFSVVTVFNTVYGGGVTSKLFRLVREQLQLCYYVGSRIDISKGLMFVYSGIDFANFEKTKEAVLSQLEEMKSGNISDEEMQWAKAGVRSDLRAIPDSPNALEGYYFKKILGGFDTSPEEYIEMLEDVTKEDLVELANSIVPDLVYFLRDDPESGSGSADDGNPVESAPAVQAENLQEG